MEYPVSNRKLWKAATKELSNSEAVLAMFTPSVTLHEKACPDGGSKTIIQLVEKCIPLLRIPIFLHRYLRLLHFNKETVMKRIMQLQKFGNCIIHYLCNSELYKYRIIQI